MSLNPSLFKKVKIIFNLFCKQKENIKEDPIQVHVIDARMALICNYRYPIWSCSNLGTHVIARKLRNKQARTEPIRFENFVIVTIIIMINTYILVPMGPNSS